MSKFAAKHVTRSHTIRLAGSPAQVFPLFEPLGERQWEPTFQPEMRYPASGEARAGAVFTTQHHFEATEIIWLIADYQPEAHQIRYVKVTPGSQVAVIEVHCEANGEGETRASVTYTWTALTEKGNEEMAKMTEEHYRQYISGWATAINDFLRNGN